MENFDEEEFRHLALQVYDLAEKLAYIADFIEDYNDLVDSETSET